MRILNTGWFIVADLSYEVHRSASLSGAGSILVPGFLEKIIFPYSFNNLMLCCAIPMSGGVGRAHILAAFALKIDDFTL
jgi:hypothetical protein